MSKTKILIVEDEAIVARDLSMHLKELGYDPIACTPNGEEALSLAGRLHPDLVLMDIQLTGALDGISTAQKLREQFSLPVVFLTAFSGDAIIGRAKQAESFGYIIKPFESRELKTAIEIALYRYKAEKEIQEQRESMSMILRTAPDGFILTDLNGQFLDVNDAYCRMVGYSKEELLGSSLSSIEADESESDIHERGRKLTQQGVRTLERRHRCRDGSLVHLELSANYLPVSGGRIFCFLRDITERKRVEAERLLALRLLEIINSSLTLHELMQAVTLLIRDWSGCEAVGIRLRQDEDFPYFETRGFPDDFVKLENQLCLYGPDGQMVCDGNGNPVLECMCGNILCGRFDPSKPFFTPHGSFWTNATTELLATTSDADRQARTRNRCNGEGYETVALIPLRVGETTYGLLQLNDKRPGQLSLERIALLEQLGDNLALAVAHRIAMGDVIISEKKFRSYMENAPVGIAVVDQSGRYREVNPSMSELLGYSSRELLELSVSDMGVSTSIPQAQPSFDILKERGKHSTELQLKKKDGTKIWIFLHAVRISDSLFLGFHIDITARKQTEQRLILNEAELVSIYDNVPTMMCLLDEKGRVVRLNRAAVHFAGRPDSELLNHGCGEIFCCIHAEDNPCGCGFGLHCQECPLNQAILNSIQKGERSAFVEVERSKKLQEQVRKIWISGSTVRLNVQGYVRILLCVEDITSRKQLESQYLRAQRLESLGFLASGIAHDLNNVLSPILMGGSVLESVLTDEENQSILRSMMDAVRRGSDTVNQLLTFAQGGKGEPILVQPRHLLKEIGRLLKQTLPKNIQYYSDFGPNLSNIHVNPSQLHQVLMNLSVNARDAMPDGGVLTIAVEGRTLGDDAPLLHPKAVRGEYLIFKVSDTGDGIPPEVIDRIFDPFFTTKPQGQGTGLGLATVLGIVQGHGGFVLVDSQLGKGTAFSVYLPAAPDTIDDPTAVQESADLLGQGELILVVDDESGIRKLLQSILERRGYRVVAAESVMEAMELYRKHQEEIRVVLTDLMMPFVDGNAFIVQLRALNPFLKIIAMSGLATHSQKDKILVKGANAFLRKPLEVEKLISVLEDLLYSERIPLQ
jgi:two-component system, cell cycle sensor histidine kinase and response regulator CckA